MSLRVFPKLLGCVGITAFLWSALPTASWAQQFGTPVGASCTTCAPACQTHHCPPAYKHCFEGAPHIHWHRGCPHPICNPCDLPHWGYFETCWSPWPFQPNWGHCLTPPPAASVILNPMVNPNLPPQRRPMVLPQPGIAPSPMPMPPGPVEEFPQPRRLEQR